MIREFRLGLCGWGTVARAFHRLCEKRSDELAGRYGVQLRIVAMSSRTLPAAAQTGSTRQYPDVLDIAELNGLDAVVELIGGTDTATEIASRTLKSGRHFLTANKALLSQRGRELGDLAREQSVRIGFEAAVAGAIPVIRVLRSSGSFTAGEVVRFEAILNGTCNFILSAMEEGMDFSAALKEAQEKGFAEADPALDIDGSDALSKLTVILHLIYATPLTDAGRPIKKEGIAGLEPFDFRMAGHLGFRIRHLAIAQPDPDRGEVEAGIYPAMIAERAPLANVQRENNGIFWSSKAAGEQFMQGPGAGGDATASALLADALDIALNPDAGEFLGRQNDSVRLISSEDYSCPHYLRLDLRHLPGTLAKLTRMTGELGINIDSIEQHQTEDESMRRVVLMLHDTSEKKLALLLNRLADYDAVAGTPFHLRVISPSR